MQDVPFQSSLLLRPLRQARGEQVKAALEGTGTTIDTHSQIGDINTGCRILAVSQASDSRGEDLFGDGYDVVLRLRLSQLVFVSNSSLLSPDDIQDIVRLGFERGAGGRVAFRSLLHEHPSFSSIVNVEAMSQLPTALITNSPLDNLTAAPSVSSSALPSYLPSIPPPYPPPSLQLLKSPTIAPSSLPSSSVTAMPNQGSGLKSSIKYGAVLGGACVMLLASICIVRSRFPLLASWTIRSRPNMPTVSNETKMLCCLCHLCGTDSTDGSPLQLSDNVNDAKIQQHPIVDSDISNNCDEVAATDVTSKSVGEAGTEAFDLTPDKRSGKPGQLPLEPVSIVAVAIHNIRGEGPTCKQNVEKLNTNAGSQTFGNISLEFDPFEKDEENLDDYIFDEHLFEESENFLAGCASSRPLEEQSQPSVSSSKTPRVHNTSLRRHESLTCPQASHQEELMRDLWDKKRNMGMPWQVQHDADEDISALVDGKLCSLLDSTQQTSRPRISASSCILNDWNAHDVFGVEEESKINSAKICNSDLNMNVPLTVIGRSASPFHNLSDAISKSGDTIESIPLRSRSGDSGMNNSHSPSDSVPAATRARLRTANLKMEPFSKDLIPFASKCPALPEDVVITLDDASVDTIDTGNPWLFDAIEQTLGPRSSGADIETLSGRSSRSVRSNLSLRSRPCCKGSESSSIMATIGVTRSANDSHETGVTRPRHNRQNAPQGMDMQPLERPEIDRISTISTSSSSTYKSASYTLTKELTVPPGKLGVVLADHHDGRGAVIANVRLDSVVVGRLLPGDKIGEI